LPTPFLSIIIPAHNEEFRLPRTLELTNRFLQAQPYEGEVIVVENGSQDRTLEIALQYSQQHPSYRVLSEKLPGKGRAVRAGMLAARGEYRFMCDADFSMPVDEINRFLPPALPDVEIAIASREAPGAIRYDEPSYRHFVGRVFNTFSRWLVMPGYHDTQCGFKCFRGGLADELFREQTLMGWSFDVEILVIARRRGYSIVEIPIPWYFNPESKINVLRDSFQMAFDLLHIRWNTLRGLYGPLGAERHPGHS
jgi:dolichyl-phosphate beta-glucosyltransferase